MEIILFLFKFLVGKSLNYENKYKGCRKCNSWQFERILIFLLWLIITKFESLERKGKYQASIKCEAMMEKIWRKDLIKNPFFHDTWKFNMHQKSPIWVIRRGCKMHVMNSWRRSENSLKIHNLRSSEVVWPLRKI